MNFHWEILWRSHFFSLNSCSLWKRTREKELPLKTSAMILFLFLILVFCSKVIYTLVPDSYQVAKNLKDFQFDCGARTEKLLYALNQVRQSHITTENLAISRTKINLYTKHFRKLVNMTKCQIKRQQEKRHCGHNDHSSIDHTIAWITSDLVISPEQCRSLAKETVIYLTDQILGAE